MYTQTKHKLLNELFTKNIHTLNQEFKLQYGLCTQLIKNFIYYCQKYSPIHIDAIELAPNLAQPHKQATILH